MYWRIYYSDGSTVDNTQSSWDDASSDGVVCVVVKDEDYGRFVLNGLNYYYTPETPAPGDVAHTNDIGPQLRMRCPWLKYGVGVSREKWKSILIKATKDPDFGPPKAPRRRSTDK